MVKEIVVEPVTRLEGHGGLRIVIGDDGKVKDAQFNLKSNFYLKVLKHTQRYIITGQLSGQIIESEDITRNKFTMGLDIFDSNTLKRRVA